MSGNQGVQRPCNWCGRTKNATYKIVPAGDWPLTTAPIYYVCVTCLDLGKSVIAAQAYANRTRSQRVIDAQRARSREGE